MTEGIRFASTLTLALSCSSFADEMEPGCTYRLYDIGRPIDRLYQLGPDQTPNIDRLIETIDFPDDASFGGPADRFFVEVLGYLLVEDEGEYGFRITSDDGSLLRVGDEEIIRHDGTHPPTSKDGAVVLDRGLHAFHIDMFENGGGAALKLEWRPPGASDFALVPTSALRIEKGTTRVVSPGLKKILDGKEHLEPGDGMPLDRVHPGWIVEDLRPEGFEPQVGGMAFLPDGRLVLSSFEPVNNGIFREEPNGTIWTVSGLLDGGEITVEQIADGFHDPAGLTVVDGDIYVAHRTDITKLSDGDGDGVFETRDVFASGWVSDNYHHFTFGLVHHEGWLYATLSTSIYFGNTIEADNVTGQVVSMNGPNPEYRGSCFRVALDDGTIDWICGGFRTPNGIGLGPGGDIFVADNQGAWLPASKLIHVQRGRFFGHANGRDDQASDTYPDGGYPALYQDQPESPPVVWLPQNECANSPAESLLIRRGPFIGQMYLSEITMGGIRRVSMEKVDGEWQGCVYRFTQGLECGVNRLIEGPDGCLYVGGTGASGNWSWRNTRFGLQRLRPSGKAAFEIHTVSATATGFDITFTRPIDTEWLRDPENYHATQWHYEPTEQYGGPKHDVQPLAVTHAEAFPEAAMVRLTIPDLREGCVVHLRMDPESVDGEELWSKEAWYTLNAIPKPSR